MRRLMVVSMLAVSILGTVMMGTGEATFPGHAGRISMTVFSAAGINIATIQPNGTNIRVLTHNPTNSSSLGSAWSPNGRLLAFDRFPRSGGGQVWLMRADGTGKRMVVGRPGAVPSVFDDSPAWSPDGRWIIFVHAGGAGREQLWAVHPNSTAMHRVLAIAGHNLENPTFSPDGRHVVFTEQLGPNSSRLAAINADGTNLRPIPNTKRLQAFGDSWSPDGRWIAFANHQFTGLSSIYVIHPNGHGLRRVTRPGRNAYNDLFPVWSPEGDQIAFQRSKCPNSTNGCPFNGVAIWVIGSNGSHPHTITHNPANNYLDADWGSHP